MDVSFLDQGADQRSRIPVMGGNRHEPVDRTAACNGQGSGSKVLYTNTVTELSTGLKSPGYIGLAHELIHASHSLAGDMLDGPLEEQRTVGLNAYATQEITENKIRLEANLPLRTAY